MDNLLKAAGPSSVNCRHDVCLEPVFPFPGCPHAVPRRLAPRQGAVETEGQGPRARPYQVGMEKRGF